MTNHSQNLKNNFYFKKILKFCSLSIRSEYEVLQKLDNFEQIDPELKEEILNFFIKLRVVVSDADYLRYYLENLSQSKGYTYNQLFLKLSKKVKNQSLLKNTLKEFFTQNGDSQIIRFIERNERKLRRMDTTQKRIQYLTQKGFQFNLIKENLPKYNL